MVDRVEGEDGRALKPRLKRVVQKRVRKGGARPARNIGVDVKPPARSCSDPKCPFHGTLPVRGQIIEGIVKSNRMQRSVVVCRERRFFVHKFERYERRTSSYLAHCPPCIEAKPGDWVKIMECRPLSKAKSFVVIERRPGK